ncbi:MAG TPA: hypothetical protein VEU08_01215 [Vicinamibacterales bacterium]|nr:hypothetical protein [Vicinamibacterales bacterium]
MTMRISPAMLALALSVAAPAAAQQAMTFGSPDAGARGKRPDSQSSYEKLTEHPKLVFEPFTPDGAFRARTARLQLKTLGPFDASKYGFDTLRFLFDRETVPEDQRSGFESNSRLQLAVELARQGSPSRWLRMAARKDAAIEDADLLAIEDEADENESATAATPDAALPIVNVAYHSSSQGVSVHGESSTSLLVDFRSAPAVLAAHEAVETEGGGVCGVWDNQYFVADEYGCRWDPSHEDFLCAHTEHRRDTPWGERRGSRWFYLATGMSAFPPLDEDPAAPRTLAALAERIAADPRAPKEGLLKDLGLTKMILELPSKRVANSRLFLFASSSLAYRFDGRFFVVRVTPGKRALTFVATTNDTLGGRDVILHRDQPDGGPEPPSFTPDGEPQSYKASIVSTQGYTRVARVVVDEMRGRGVYYIGVEETPSKTVADAFLVASDTAYYDQCARWIVPPTAVSASVSPAANSAFRARLDIEPGRTEDDFDEGLKVDDQLDPADDDLCAVTRTLTWKSGEGFALSDEDAPETCPDAPLRRVAISPDGAISVRSGGRPPA